VGIDLKVMASHFREVRGEFLPTATLRFERDPGLFARLAQGASPSLVRPLPAGLKVGLCEDQGLTFADADRHGQRLTFTTPALLGPHVAWPCPTTGSTAAVGDRSGGPVAWGRAYRRRTAPLSG
jgi:hypothetical protein